MNPSNGRHDPFLQFFKYDHLPDDLKIVAHRFQDLAMWVDENLPRNPERSFALRKLLEGKDCAIRALLYRD
jgi:hypothetical protein